MTQKNKSNPPPLVSVEQKLEEIGVRFWKIVNATNEFTNNIDGKYSQYKHIFAETMTKLNADHSDKSNPFDVSVISIISNLEASEQFFITHLPEMYEAQPNYKIETDSEDNKHITKSETPRKCTSQTPLKILIKQLNSMTALFSPLKRQVFVEVYTNSVGEYATDDVHCVVRINGYQRSIETRIVKHGNTSRIILTVPTKFKEIGGFDPAILSKKNTELLMSYIISFLYKSCFVIPSKYSESDGDFKLDFYDTSVLVNDTLKTAATSVILATDCSRLELPSTSKEWCNI